MPNLKKAALLAIAITLVVMTWWEVYLRSRKYPISFDENNALFANNRAMVYEPKNSATVFIGSSRIKFDLDIKTWESITGNHAIQLANTGSDPKPYLNDLANDNNFTGKLVIDVTEGLFFDPGPPDREAIEKIAYYHKITPTQRFSFQVNRVLESSFVFLEEHNFSFNALLDKSGFPKRPTVFSFPIFPVGFTCNTFDRQCFMTPEFVKDTAQQNQMKAVWAFFGSLPGPPPASGKLLDSIFNIVKINIDKIKKRGGDVIFVRTPSSGPVLEEEHKYFPRKIYWDQLLKSTGCKGIYFSDFPAISNFSCPESSHLSPADAIVYTKNLIKYLEEAGWKFYKKPA